MLCNIDTKLQLEDMASSMMPCRSQRLVEEERQERAVEREASREIIQLRVDGGGAIDVSEALAAEAAAGSEAKRAGARSSSDEPFFGTYRKKRVLSDTTV